MPVGVAYGSDLAMSMELMRRVAEEHPLVLDDPKPWVTFDSFGDNALQLTLRCFLGSVDNRIRVRSEIHLAIDAAFRAAAINIAFPQRDIHLDAAAPLPVRLVGETSGPENNNPPGSAMAGRSSEQGAETGMVVP